MRIRFSIIFKLLKKLLNFAKLCVNIHEINTTGKPVPMPKETGSKNPPLAVKVNGSKIPKYTTAVCGQKTSENTQPNRKAPYRLFFIFFPKKDLILSVKEKLQGMKSSIKMPIMIRKGPISISPYCRKKSLTLSASAPIKITNVSNVYVKILPAV